MGMFDEVTFKCPNCGEKLVEQSNAGKCDLKNYHQSSVPAAIAEDLKDTKIYCEVCDMHLYVAGNIPRVSLHLISEKSENGYD